MCVLFVLVPSTGDLLTTTGFGSLEGFCWSCCGVGAPRTLPEKAMSTVKTLNHWPRFTKRHLPDEFVFMESTPESWLKVLLVSLDIIALAGITLVRTGKSEVGETEERLASSPP